MQAVLAWILLAVALGAAWLLWMRISTGQRGRQRLFDDTATTEVFVDREASLDGVRGWLYRAGYRDPLAVELFVLTTVGCLVLGMMAAWFYSISPLRPQLLRGLEGMPSGLGEVFLPFAQALPWLLVLVLSALPTLRVRAARRRRVEWIEQDLAITLELLATLSEAGIGFDAGLERILSSQPADRPLAQEFRQFQIELLAGRPRVQCLRRLARRIDVPSLTIFISALVQASQVGAGTAEVLRRQVEDLRNRRRENALTTAAALPVKLLFPLVLCFIPGIFVAALGPAFYQVFQLFDTLNRARGRP